MQRSILSIGLFVCLDYVGAVQFRSAICFLTRQPRIQTVGFAQQLSLDVVQHAIDVFVMVDDNHFDASSVKSPSPARILKLQNNFTIRNGFHDTISLSHLPAEVTSWDKALFYFTSLQPIYSYVWLIEEDTFIPSAHALLSLHQLYANRTDLIASTNTVNLNGNTSEWHWHLAAGKMAPPWSRSMMNLVGMSRRLLDIIDEYVQWRGFVPFHEFFFNTLALQRNLTIVTPRELSTIVFSETYAYEQIQQRPYNFWHPVKDLQSQTAWRRRFVRWHMLIVISLSDEITKLDVRSRLLAYSSNIDIKFDCYQ
jgi:hypothetical protein